MIENYQFEDFTELNYLKIMDLIKTKYKTIFFSDYKRSGRNLLLRHDVDCSMHRAYKIAQIESETGIQSTFFLWIHCPYYNIFEKEVYNLIKNIILLGHEIGLHFDYEFFECLGFDQDMLIECMIFEKGLLEKVFGQQIKAFSFHNPSIEVIENFKGDSYCEMINTYSLYLRENYNYCSDSNGYWRFQRLEDVLMKAESDKLQVLLHPEWWTPDLMSPRERISRCIDGRARRNHEQYDNLLEEMGRLNIL